jgi:hypothetical protein
LQSLELVGGSSEREAKLRDQIDRVRSQEQRLADRFEMESDDGDDDDELDEELESTARKPVSRLVKRRKP